MKLEVILAWASTSQPGCVEQQEASKAVGLTLRLILSSLPACFLVPGEF